MSDDFTAFNEDLKRKLGYENYNRILDAVKSHKIDEKQMRDFAYSLGPNIGGSHARRMKHKGECDQYEIRQILCMFYRDEMCKKENIGHILLSIFGKM